MDKFRSVIAYYKRQPFKMRWLPEKRYDFLKHLTQAGFFCFDENKRLLVIKDTSEDKWMLPTCSIVDKNFNIEDILHIIEKEIGFKLTNIIYLGVLKIAPIDGKPFCELNFTAKINKDSKEFANNNKNQKIAFIDSTDFGKTLGLGKIGDKMVSFALEKNN